MPLKQSVETLAQRSSQFEAPRHPQGWHCCPAAGESSAACAWGRVGAAHARPLRAAQPGACAAVAWGALLRCPKTRLQREAHHKRLHLMQQCHLCLGIRSCWCTAYWLRRSLWGRYLSKPALQEKGHDSSLVEDPTSAPGNEQSNLMPPSLASTGGCALRVCLDLCCQIQSTCGSPKKWRALITWVGNQEAYLHPCHSHRCSSQPARQPPLLQPPLHRGIASYRRDISIGLQASQQPQSQILAALCARDTTAAQRQLLTIVLHPFQSPTCSHRTPGHPCKEQQG